MGKKAGSKMVIGRHTELVMGCLRLIPTRQTDAGRRVIQKAGTQQP